jgi:ribose-phosphate pyrophosphokinase
MKYLNLSKGFTPYKGEEISFKKFIFAGGEPHIKIDTTTLGCGERVMITQRIATSEDFIFLLLAAEALQQSGSISELYLTLPYFPGARQDRRMVEGEPFTLKVYANLINEASFDEVVILDPHSDVTPALINNVTVVNNHVFVDQAILDIEGMVPEHYVSLVSPDAGASKKITSLAKYVQIQDIIKCDKDRDVTNGNIKGFEVHSKNIQGKTCVIVDDICDGGGTFVGLAQKLREEGAKRVYLVVTHGIFSKGFKQLNAYFDGIYTTDSFPNIDDKLFTQRWDNTIHKVVQIKLNEFL